MVEAGVIIGSAALATDTIDTGTWPAGATVTLQINSGGYIVGRGGKGASATGSVSPEAGSDAINMSFALELINNGIIGGGGGGGGYSDDGDAEAAGGGGAGNDVGSFGTGTQWIGSGSPSVLRYPSNGTISLGGQGGQVTQLSSGSFTNGGIGGVLGAVGASGSGGSSNGAGGAAGSAINKNSFVLTQTTAGDIRGAINA